MTTVRWRINPIGVTFSGSDYDPDFFDGNVIKAFNRFANSATLVIDDVDGSKSSSYPRGRRVEIEASTDGGSNYNRFWAGFVQDVVDKTEQGKNVLQLELVGYDHLLKRRDDIYEDYSSTAISTIIQDVIETYTPVTYVGGNVTVVNDISIDYTTDQTRVDEILKELSAISGEEDFGVNDDFEFFFEPRESGAAPGSVVDGDYFGFDLPQEGKRSVNRVRINYGSSGSESFATVEDRAAQQDLKDELNAAGNVVLSLTKTYPNISTEDEAKRKAENLLGTFSTIQTGTVSTFDRFTWDPGETFRLQISEKDIDDTFRIAQLEWDYREDQTQITVAEQSQVGNDELLVELSDDVKRIDARAADGNADGTQFLQLTSGITVESDLTITRTNVSSGVFTPGLSRDSPGLSRDNLGFGSGASFTPAIQSITVTRAGLNRFRDAWQGESVNTIDTVKFGTGSTDASIGDTDLETSVDSTSGTANASGSFEINVSGTLSSGGAADGVELTEVGFLDSSGTLLARATFNATLHSSEVTHDADLTLTLETDSELFGVITETGQTEVRNGWIDGTIDEATDMSFGTGTTAADETDTALGAKVIEKTLSSTSDGTTGLSNVIARLGTGEGNGNDLAELGEENVNDDLLSRVTFEAIAKTSDAALESNHRFRARNL